MKTARACATDVPVQEREFCFVFEKYATLTTSFQYDEFRCPYVNYTLYATSINTCIYKYINPNYISLACNTQQATTGEQGTFDYTPPPKRRPYGAICRQRK